ncbi:MAG: hypothetical protein MJA28_06260 [Gammaproteobacteria bacterium]|nr:hypothetical protein [Gammaproteobacteria bacterium]
MPLLTTTQSINALLESKITESAFDADDWQFELLSEEEQNQLCESYQHDIGASLEISAPLANHLMSAALIKKTRKDH